MHGAPPMHPGMMMAPPNGQPQPPKAPTPPALNAPSLNLPKKTSDWQEHTSNDGTKYYHNKKTGESKWTKPVELQSPEEKAAERTGKWKVCYGQDGRKYYYNKETKESLWTAPPQIQALAKQIAAQEEAQANKIAQRAAQPTFKLSEEEKNKLKLEEQLNKNKRNSHRDQDEPVIKAPVTGKVNVVKMDVSADDKKQDQDKRKDAKQTSSSDPSSSGPSSSSAAAAAASPSVKKGGEGAAAAAASSSSSMGKKVYANKEEAVEAFKSLLKDKGVTSRDKWSQIMQKIIHDPRYQALRTVKERKNILEEYKDEIGIVEEQERMEAEKKAKTLFFALLESCEWIHEKTPWAEFRDKNGSEAKFIIVTDERRRKDYFYDYRDELEAKNRKMRKEKRKANIAILKEKLKSEECSWVTADATWRDAKEHGIVEMDGAKDLDKEDVVEVFDDIIKDLRDKEREKKAREKEKRRKQERKLRDEFRKVLEGKALDGLLHSKSDWDDVKEVVKEEECYVQLSAMTKAKITASDVFEDFAQDLEDRIASPKKHVKTAIKAKMGNVKHDSDLVKVIELIKDDPDLEDIEEEDVKLSVIEVIAKAQHKHKEREKKIKRYIKTFEKDLRKYLARAFADDLKALKKTPMDEAVEKCSSKLRDTSAFEKLEQKQKQASFEKICLELLDDGDMDVENGGEEEEEVKSSSKKKKRKRKRGSSESSDNSEESDDDDEDSSKKKKKKSSSKSSKKKKSKKKRRRDDSRSGSD